MPLSRRGLQLVIDLLIAAVAVGAITGAGWSLRMNPTTAAVLLFLGVLLVAARRGVMAGVVASIVATACLNYFFLPPLYTWNVEDPENWVALACLLGASTVAGRMLARIRREVREATARRTEVESLYRLSVDLLEASSLAESLPDLASRAWASSESLGGGVVLFAGTSHRQRVLFWIGQRPPFLEEMVRDAGRLLRTIETGPAPGRDAFVPLVSGGRALGVLVLLGSRATTKALESIAALLAVAVERAFRLAEDAHVEALRASDELKTALLRAVSHDLKSPLTAISLHIERLKRMVPAPMRKTVATLDSETRTVNRRIDGLLAMARLEAGALVPVREPVPVPDLFRSTRESLSSVVGPRRIAVEIEPECPEIDTDPSLALEILVNLAENAHRASPPGEPLVLRATTDRGDRRWLRVEVLDRGPGIDERSGSDRPLSRYPDSSKAQFGLGLEIAQGLARALGGKLSFEERYGGGTAARLDLPVAVLAATCEG